MDKVRWGVIGAGGIAKRRVIPEVINYGKKSEIIAIEQRNREAAKECAKEFKINYWYDNIEDLLSNREIDAVYIATPNYLHREQTIMAARAKKHVLCEKPLGINVKECVDMIEECKRNNVKLGVGFMMRFHGLHQKIKEIIENGVIGKTVLGRAQLTCWYPKIEDAWRQNPKLSGGGSLIDMGSHCIDILETLLSTKVKEVFSFQDNLVQGYPVEDTSVVLLRFNSGAVGIVDNCFNVPDKASKNVLEIYGAKGSIFVEGSIGQEPTGKGFLHCHLQKEYESKQKRTVEEFKPQEIKYDIVRMYATELDHISQCILDDTEPVISGEVGLWNQKIISACYESAKLKKAIEIV
ncbi:MAG: Gfo/Idh/MocA family oxidoreductase [Candidatus Bathyarchaeia archaeon]